MFGANTGHVSFTAQQTSPYFDGKGQLVYSDSLGGYLHGVVTCFNQVGDHAAVFSGVITDGSPDYMAPPNPYFIAKVVDNGTPGTAGPDQIAVWANEGPHSCVRGLDTKLADVTNGNLDVH